MVSKHCLSCGVEAHPRPLHPSSLRVEVTVWMLAIVVGLMAGTWVAATSPSTPPIRRALQSLALSASRSTEQPTEIAEGNRGGSPSLGMQLAVSARRAILEFLRTAWWVLPLPLLFSLWRQFKKYEACPACGSRRLIPIVTPHGEAPPEL